MIELKDNALEFSFRDVHPDARVVIDFQRTLRIPDDNNNYPLPPGLGRFPLRQVDDFASTVPPLWIEHGGVMLPMYQSEAMWLNFQSEYLYGRRASYPFALKVAAGKINAATGDEWTDRLNTKPQDYVVVPEQPWLDGYCVKKGIIRQFVAMPLGAGYSAEEQLTGKAEHGGLQIIVYPMKREVFERRFPKIEMRSSEADFSPSNVESPRPMADFCLADMGLAPGGQMHQEIYADPYGIEDWDLDRCSRCYVHIANSLVWRSITGENPPTVPPTAKEYTNAGMPWFEYYSEDSKPIKGSKKLKSLKSVVKKGKEKGDMPFPENEPVTPANIIQLRKGLKKNQVREGVF